MTFDCCLTCEFNVHGECAVSSGEVPRPFVLMPCPDHSTTKTFEEQQQVFRKWRLGEL